MPRHWLGVWAPLPPRSWFRPPLESLPFPLEDPGCRLYRRGRHAVWHGLRALGIGPGDSVLTPAYHSGPDIEALKRVGVSCRFYGRGEGLAPDPVELGDIIDSSTKCLYLIHYNGFPQDTPRWRSWCDERGLLLVEDAAQSLLARVDGRPVGSLGDLAFFSLYKMLPTPDGSAAVCAAPMPRQGRSRHAGVGSLAHLHGAWLGQRFGWIGSMRPRRSRAFDPSTYNALGDPDAPVAAATAYLLPRLADDRVAERRRSNYARLLRELRPYVPAPFDELPDGACPWFFPVVADDRAGLLRDLAAQGVSGMAVWSVPHPLLPSEGFPEAHRRRSRTVALPVHHELSGADVDRIVDVAGGLLGGRR